MNDPDRPADELAVFPLGTVLFPGGPLSLRIFEPRYLEMISDCLRRDRPFAVCLIADGREAGAAARPHEVGTLARVADWSQLDGGLLGITAHGTERVRLHDVRVEPSQLVVARVETLPHEPPAAVPERHAMLAELAAGLVDHAATLYAHLPRRIEDATWVGYRLAELLPLPLAQKQDLLELDDAVVRLDRLDEVVRAIAERSP